MAALSWNDIKARAASFVNDWRDIAPRVKEEAEAQTFENDFFNIFDVSRKKVALFEKKVPLKDGYSTGVDLFGEPVGGQTAQGYIDLFWKGYIIIEMKTPGKDLKKAYEQAKAYANALPAQDLPKGILISDFLNFHYYDLTKDAQCTMFRLEELPEYVELFGYLAGYGETHFKKTDPVNIEAAEKMSALHNALKANGYDGHKLEVYLVRLLFCLFADDTGIFEHDHFLRYIIERTNPDGKDLPLHLQKIFETLNKDESQRSKAIDEQLNKFPYVDGGLFEELLETAEFDVQTRETLIQCCALDWSKISPDIFGAMFQGVMDDVQRHDIGAHYTSEENILKIVRPLFLDGLRDEFAKIKKLTSDIRRQRLMEFHDKLAGIKIFDPACGCGNFLVICYRELRLLELDVIAEYWDKNRVLDISQLIKVNVNQFYGIEIDEFPAKIAQTALWLTDHQMNMLVRDRFGNHYTRFPLSASAFIYCGNALTADWESLVPKSELSYILGNPPFLGASVMNKEQKKELQAVFEDMKGCDSLDYVSCWYKKAADYMRDTAIEAAFVSTNSICQGEQVPILWQNLMNAGIKINFAHQTFKWSNEARGKAAVYCVIVGFSYYERKNKTLFSYAEVTGGAVKVAAKQINAYLVDAENIFIKSRALPISEVSEMAYGSKPTDGGYLLFTREEKDEFIKLEPESKKYIKPLISAHEYLHGKERYCLWLIDVEPAKLKKMPHVIERLKLVQKSRLASTKQATRDLAKTPGLFEYISHPNTNYIMIPCHSSEQRQYIPMGFMDKNSIANNSCEIIPNATLYEFGVLTSAMHMAWMRSVCGRLKSDYRYSSMIVYNNYPWPSPEGKQRKAVEAAARKVLEAREKYPESCLADLYDPLTMPPDLMKAHQKLDKAVEIAYGREFDNDSQRVAYLFELYQTMAAELFKDERKRGKGRKIVGAKEKTGVKK